MEQPYHRRLGAAIDHQLQRIVQAGAPWRVSGSDRVMTVICNDP
jgi:hypothetical protein